MFTLLDFQEEVISPKVLDCLKRISEWLAGVFELVGPENPKIPQKTGIQSFVAAMDSIGIIVMLVFKDDLLLSFILFTVSQWRSQNQVSDK